MSKNSRITLFTAILVLAGGSVLTGCDSDKTQQHTQAQPAHVGIVTLKSQLLTVTTELPGRTAAFRIAEVRPQISGIILQRHFVEGSDVTALMSMYQIDPAPYEAVYNSAKGELAKAQAAAALAKLTVGRYQPLLGTQYISQQEYDEAVSGLRQANASVIVAQAAVETARINLAYTRVTAPISGRSGQSSVTEGALVTSGQAAPLVTVQQINPIYVAVTQSSDAFLRLRKELASGALKQKNSEKDGKTAIRLLLDDNSEYAQTGTLDFTGITVDESTNSITIRALFPNPDQLLLPGMFVRARLDGVKNDALLVPQRSVTRNPRGDAVAMVVGEGNKVELRTLTTGRAIGDQWLVTSGLKAGDRVIVTGAQKIRPGAQVTIQEITTPVSHTSPAEQVPTA